MPSRLAVYPGSFDPFTNGHLDLVERAANLFDRVVVSIAVNSSKNTLFTVEERLDLLREVLGTMPNVDVSHFSGLLVDYCHSIGAKAIVRGIRAVTDFDYEYAIYQLNQELNPNVETVFLLAAKEYSFVSSTLIKEVARYGRSVEAHAPSAVNRELLKKFGHSVST